MMQASEQMEISGGRSFPVTVYHIRQEILHYIETYPKNNDMWHNTRYAPRHGTSPVVLEPQLTARSTLLFALEHHNTEVVPGRNLMAEGSVLVTCEYNNHRTAATVRIAGNQKSGSEEKAGIRSKNSLRINANNKKN